MTTVTSREFNRDPSSVKRAAAEGPVLITDRGQAAFVLLSIEEYERIRGGERTLVSRLSMDDDLDWEPEPIHVGLRIPEL